MIPAISMAYEEAESDIMKRMPRNDVENLICYDHISFPLDSWIFLFVEMQMFFIFMISIFMAFLMDLLENYRMLSPNF